jgi:hypothetical protein
MVRVRETDDGASGIRFTIGPQGVRGIHDEVGCFIIQEITVWLSPQFRRSPDLFNHVGYFGVKPPPFDNGVKSRM